MNNAIASTNAKPKIALLNNSELKLGFREILVNNPFQIIPIPLPTPANAIVAKPAPNILNSNNIEKKKEEKKSLERHTL